MARTKRSSNQVGADRDNRPEHILEAAEGSLHRLGTDYIDLLYQHRVKPRRSVRWPTLSMTWSSGEATIFGLSQAGGANIRRAHAVCGANIQRPSNGHFHRGIVPANGSGQVALLEVLFRASFG
jgi:aryl-alcohol dehydrogenase-like predicted oxidoreductase